MVHALCPSKLGDFVNLQYIQKYVQLAPMPTCSHGASQFIIVAGFYLMAASCVVWRWLSSACSPPGYRPTYLAWAGVGLLEYTHSRCHSHPLASSLHEAVPWPGSETPGVPTSLHTLDEPSPGGGIPACGVAGVRTHTLLHSPLSTPPHSQSLSLPLPSHHILPHPH